MAVEVRSFVTTVAQVEAGVVVMVAVYESSAKNPMLVNTVAMLAVSHVLALIWTSFQLALDLTKGFNTLF